MIINTVEDVFQEIHRQYLSKFIQFDKVNGKDWDVFRKHIETHKYLLNEKYKTEIPLSAAYESWAEYVMTPFISTIIKYDIMRYTELNIIDLFKKIMFDWDELKKKIPKNKKNIGVAETMEKYCIELKKFPKTKKFILKYFK